MAGSPATSTRRREADAFSAALEDQLRTRRMTKADLARARGVSQAYVSRLASASNVSPEWVDFICEVTQAQDAARVTLHRAAAIRAGYKIDLQVKVKIESLPSPPHEPEEGE
jgi:transcriptional regulator with XRE-family HTH domain